MDSLKSNNYSLPKQSTALCYDTETRDEIIEAHKSRGYRCVSSTSGMETKAVTFITKDGKENIDLVSKKTYNLWFVLQQQVTVLGAHQQRTFVSNAT